MPSETQQPQPRRRSAAIKSAFRKAKHALSFTRKPSPTNSPYPSHLNPARRSSASRTGSTSNLSDTGLSSTDTLVEKPATTRRQNRAAYLGPYYDAAILSVEIPIWSWN